MVEDRIVFRQCNPFLHRDRHVSVPVSSTSLGLHKQHKRKPFPLPQVTQQWVYSDLRHQFWWHRSEYSGTSARYWEWGLDPAQVLDPRPISCSPSTAIELSQNNSPAAGTCSDAGSPPLLCKCHRYALWQVNNTPGLPKGTFTGLSRPLDWSLKICSLQKSMWTVLLFLSSFSHLWLNLI